MALVDTVFGHLGFKKGTLLQMHKLLKASGRRGGDRCNATDTMNLRTEGEM